MTDQFVTVAGRKFAIIGPPGNALAVQPVRWHGADWWSFRCDRGWRPTGDNPAVGRVGLDGWPDPFPAGATVDMAFSLRPLDHACAEAAGDWLDMVEMHAITQPGDVSMAGPLTMGLMWSAGDKRGVFRITQNTPVEDGEGRMIGSTAKILYQGDMAAFQPYDFRVQVKDDLRTGFVKVWLYGKLIVDTGPHGFGYGRRLYSQFRAYRNDRPTSTRLMVRIDEFGVTS